MRKILLIIVPISIILVLIIEGIYPTRPLQEGVIIDKILVEKSKRKMYVYSNNQLIKTYRISLGKVPNGAKEFEGDKKTPEGLYSINDKNPNSDYHKNLGISYPNKQNVEFARKHNMNPGGQVKIHGLNRKVSWIGRFHLLIDWTAGCIAVTNSEIDELFDAVSIGTPIEIRK